MRKKGIESFSCRVFFRPLSILYLLCFVSCSMKGVEYAGDPPILLPAILLTVVPKSKSFPLSKVLLLYLVSMKVLPSTPLREGEFDLLGLATLPTGAFDLKNSLDAALALLAARW